VKLSNNARAILVSACAAILLASAPTEGSNFVATAYNNPGHPVLTSAQVALIKKTLARVKPCQRALVRYGLFGPSTTDIVFFFAVGPRQGTHPFGQGSVMYFPDGGYSNAVPDNGDAAKMEREGIQWDIDHQPCPTATSPK